MRSAAAGQLKSRCEFCGKPFDDSQDGTSRANVFWLGGRKSSYKDVCQPCYETDIDQEETA